MSRSSGSRSAISGAAIAASSQSDSGHGQPPAGLLESQAHVASRFCLAGRIRVMQAAMTSALTELVAAARPGPAERDRARLLLADYLAVAGAGAEADSARVARDARLRRPPGPAPVLGPGRTAAVRDAALVNGIAAHSIELDDTHEPSSSHPGTVVWTALLAAGVSFPATTGAVLDGAVAGYQAMASLGELLGPAELYRQGVHPTAVCGVFGA